MQYHYNLQGAIYGLLMGGKYNYIHSKPGYKFFCFSNIFPVGYLNKNDIRHLIISSPDDGLINELFQNLHLLDGSLFVVGRMKFLIVKIERFAIDLSARKKNISIVTGTPIVMRIPKEKYESYNYKINGRYSYVYWRNGHPFELFLTQLKNNLYKKVAEYCSSEAQDGNSAILPKVTSNHLKGDPVFSFLQNFKVKKQVSTRVVMKGSVQIVIGTLWEFDFDIPKNSNTLNILNFALDAGLGEKNSLGFGFVNPC